MGNDWSINLFYQNWYVLTIEFVKGITFIKVTDLWK